jgi:uncharacterized protein YkwD
LTRCDECGKEVTLPFRCNFCKGYFCVEHRLPENHACLFAPPRTPLGHWKAKKNTKKWKTSVPVRKSYSSKSSRGKKAALAIIAISSIVLLLFVFLQNPITLPPVTFPVSSPDSTESNTTEPEVNDRNHLPVESAPDSGSKTYNHEELVNYALTLINNDRQSNGLENVTLSNINSAQIHADNMLKHDFFSHWDLNGYKPYMRYTLAGGQGSVSENCAAIYSSGSIDPKEALEDMQWNMMYDDADSDWGHRDNILNSFHNKVSIGLSSNNTAICLVQDFEDDYVSWDTLTVSNNEVIMKGTIIKQELSINQVAIYYDNPMPLTTQQLGNPPYDNGYDSGTYVGMVVCPPPSGSEYQQPDEGILIITNIWNEKGQDFNLNFDLSTAFTRCGKGVYTLYLWIESNNILTTYSVWYEG